MTEEKTFRFTADCIFEARDIDDAFKKLSRHFKALRRGEESQLLILGEMHIKPKEKK